MPDPTPFDVIIDLGLTAIDDYKLKHLYDLSKERFIKQCDAYLVAAIPNFTRCRQSLDYNTQTRYFYSSLTPMEISILADLWVIEWMKHETQDSRKINALLQSSGSFKSHSAAQNLKEKTTFLDGLREKVEQKITSYQLQDIDSLSL